MISKINRKKILIFGLLFFLFYSLKSQPDSSYYKLYAFKIENKKDSLDNFLIKNLKNYPNNNFLLSELVKNRTRKISSSLLITYAREWAKNNAEAEYYLAIFYAENKNLDSAFYFLTDYFSGIHRKSQSMCASESGFDFLRTDKRWIEFNTKNYDYDYQKVIFDAQFDASIKKYEKALNLLDNYLLKHKNHAVFAERAAVLFQSGDFNSSLNDYSRAYKIHKDNAYLKKIILTYANLNRPKKIIENAHRYLSRNKYDLEVIRLLGFAYFKIKKWSESEKYLLIYAKYLMDDSVFFSLGKCYEKNEDWLNALKNYSKAMRLKPYEASYRLARATIYFKTHNYLVADKDYTQYLDQKPKSEAVYYKRGLCRYNLNFIKKACYDWKISMKSGNQAATIEYNRHCKSQNKP